MVTISSHFSVGREVEALKNRVGYRKAHYRVLAKNIG